MIGNKELKKTLSKLLNEGDDVLVHASMNAIGKIEGGPDGLRDVILDILGHDGTILMLASTRQEFVETGVFDVRNSKSDTGSLSESLRFHPRAKRSKNPMVSFVAVGKNSQAYTMEYNSLLDESSPMMKLRENKGKILLYGIGYKKCTMYHLSEERLKVDYNFYKEFSGKLIDWDGNVSDVSQKYFVRKSLETKKDATYVGEGFENSNYQVWKQNLGIGTLRSFYAADFDDYCTEQLRKEPTIFLEKSKKVEDR